MIYQKIDFEDKTTEGKFRFLRNKHKSSWEHYSTCYNYATFKVFNKGFQENYAFNSKARALLFLIRHSFELTLKYALDSHELSIPNSHNFKDIYSVFPQTVIIPKEFENLINTIHLDIDGSCYRYYKSNGTGKAFFTLGNKIELTELLKTYNELPRDDSFKIGEICEVFDYNDEKIKWDLTLHMGECPNLGCIRTQYDEVIKYLIEGVLNDNYDIYRIYLPLLFLIRHSLELGLKSNLLQAKKMSSDKVPNKQYDKIHSLSQLYNCFGGEDGYLSKLDLKKMSVETKKQFDVYKSEYEDLNEVVHQLDNNSKYFRYPVDSKGKNHPLYISNNGLFRILKLYYLTDPFTSFTLDVLNDEGIT